MLQPRLRFAIPLIFLLINGCYGAKMLRGPIAVDNTEQRVRVLSEQQAQLMAEVEELKDSITRQEELLRSLRADTQARLDELALGVDAVGNQVQDGFDRPDAYYSAPRATPDSPTLPTGPGMSDTTVADHEVAPEQLKEIYDNAYLDLNRGNYSLALIGFKDYLDKSPDSEYSDNAQYWIGECYYAQRNFRRAIEELILVDRNYPLGDKVPAALLKIGYSLIQLEDRAAAKEMLRDLINRFPTSDEAAQARAKIQTID